MGRLHVPETGADPTIAEMGVRESGEDRWSSELDRFRLLSRVAASAPFPTAVWESRISRHFTRKAKPTEISVGFFAIGRRLQPRHCYESQDVCWFLMLLLCAS